MKRSCGRTSASVSSRTTAGAPDPGAISRPSSGATRARNCAVPWCSRTWSPERSARAAGRTETQASKRRPESPTSSGATSQSPRATSPRSTPRRFTPTRLPACTTAASWSCTCTLRTTARAPPGSTTSASPASTFPAHNVPVTTVPIPLSGKTRSTGRRAGPVAAARLRPLRGALQRGQQFDGAASVSGADRDDLAARVPRALEELPHVRLGELEQLLVDDVRLGQRHDAVTHPQQLDDREVLHGLRHHAVVRGDHQEEQVDAGRAGDHRAHEALVAGDVDDAQPAAARQLELGVAQLDRDAALLLLAQPVGVLAGEARDERGLAVVDVAGGAEGERRTFAHRRVLR